MDIKPLYKYVFKSVQLKQNEKLLKVVVYAHSQDEAFQKLEKITEENNEENLEFNISKIQEMIDASFVRSDKLAQFFSINPNK